MNALARTLRTEAPMSDVERIRFTMERVEADLAHFGSAFYRRLFERAPAVRPMFPEDVSEQATKLARMLKMLVGMLDRPEQLAEPLRNLGQRHRGYGAASAHYPVVGEVLIDTLREVNGPRFGVLEEAAWLGLFERVSTVMQSAG